MQLTVRTQCQNSRIKELNFSFSLGIKQRKINEMSSRLPWIHITPKLASASFHEPLRPTTSKSTRVAEGIWFKFIVTVANIDFCWAKLSANWEISCWSYIGLLNRGMQEVSLDDGCIASWAPGVVMHELMHTAGFWHEHMRPDRDTYVSINLNNVLQREFPVPCLGHYNVFPFIIFQWNVEFFKFDRIQTQLRFAVDNSSHHSRTFLRLWWHF